MARLVAWRRIAVIGGALLAAWQAVPQPIPTPGLLVGTQRICEGPQFGLSSRLTVIPMYAVVVDELLPGPALLGPDEQCRLRLLHEALDVSDIMAVFSPMWYRDTPLSDLSPEIRCARVELSTGFLTFVETPAPWPSAIVTGCGVDDSLSIHTDTVFAGDAVLAELNFTGGFSHHGSTSESVYSVRRIVLHQDAISDFVKGRGRNGAQ